MSGSLVTNNERNTMLNRGMKSSPDYTEISQFQFGTGTTNVTKSDTDVETGVGSKKNIETFTSSSKDSITLDETNNEVELKFTLDHGTGNSSDISEVGTFNTDGTPRAGMRANWSGRTKDNTREFRARVKNRILDV